MGVCGKCEDRFPIAIPCGHQLLRWAKETDWRRLSRFMDHSGAIGHSRGVIKRLIEIRNLKRWEIEAKNHGEALQSPRRTIEKSELLSKWREGTPGQFEQIVARYFYLCGYRAEVTGGANDDGVDVIVKNKNGSTWAIVQCKRYQKDKRIGPKFVRELAGSFYLTRAIKETPKQAFLITTSCFTEHAKSTARGYQFLKIYNGIQFAEEFHRARYSRKEDSD